MSAASDLDRALVLYATHPYGVPNRTRAALEAAFEPGQIAELVPRIDALVYEIFAIPIDWAQVQTGAVAARAVRAEFQRRHPEISDEAAAALADYWSF